MLDFELQTDASTTLQVWKMEEDLGQITAQTNLDTISGFGQLSYKRQKEKAFVNFLLQRELPKARICYNENGRPYLPDYPSTSISISHTGNTLPKCCAYATNLW